MDSNRGVFEQFVFLLAALGLVLGAWVVWGPGAEIFEQFSARLGVSINALGDWYQLKVEGPTKLIAPLITILSGSWAIWRTLKYAQSRLHYRLNDFVEREEKRLNDARDKLRMKIERPDVNRPFKAPIFLSPAMKRVVRELGWGSYFGPPQLDYVDFQVGVAIDELGKQVKASEDRDGYLKKQLATAHLLKGAILVAEANDKERAEQEFRDLLTAALNQFKAALDIVPKDVEALEYASHVHVRLNEDQESEKLLDKIIRLTAGQIKSLPRARAFRYKGGIAARRNNNGNAIKMLRQSLDALPLQLGADRVEEAEIYETLASCQEAVCATVQAAASRESAAAIRRGIFKPVPKIRMSGSSVKFR
jgi:tetratricopeptide (TPR) repeat protein